MPEDSEKMMNLVVSKQTKRTLVYIHHRSQQRSFHTAACHYPSTGKSSLIYTQYCKVEEGSSGLGEVTTCVILDSDHNTWNAYVGDKKVQDTCDVLARFQSSPMMTNFQI